MFGCHFISVDDVGDAIKAYGIYHGKTMLNDVMFYTLTPCFSMYGLYDYTRKTFRCCDERGKRVVGFSDNYDTPWMLIKTVRGIVENNPKCKGFSIMNFVFVGNGIRVSELRNRGILF